MSKWDLKWWCVIVHVSTMCGGQEKKEVLFELHGKLHAMISKVGII